MEGAGGYSGTGEEGAGGAQRNPQNQAAQKRLQQTQAKVDEVPGHFMQLIALDGVENCSIVIFYVVFAKFSTTCFQCFKIHFSG
jgi:hypothetical protein